MQVRQPNQIDPDQIRQLIFAPLNWNGIDDPTLNQLADAEADSSAIRQIVFNNQNNLLNITNIGNSTFDAKFKAQGKKDATILSNQDALALRTYARQERSRIIAEHALPLAAKITDPKVLNDLAPPGAPAQEDYRKMLKKNKDKLGNIESSRINQLEIEQLNQFKLVATILKNIGQKHAPTDSPLLTTLGALEPGNVPPTAQQMLARLANLTGAQQLNIQKFNNQLLTSLPGSVLEDIRLSAANQHGINIMRHAIQGMVPPNEAGLAALAAPGGAGGEPSTAEMQQRFVNLGGVDPAVLGRLSSDQLKAVYKHAVAQFEINRAVAVIRQMPEPNNNVLVDLTTNNQNHLAFQTAVHRQRQHLNGLSANVSTYLLNPEANHQLNLLYQTAGTQLATNKISDSISIKNLYNDNDLVTLVAAQGNADPTPQDIRTRLNQNKNAFGIANNDPVAPHVQGISLGQDGQAQALLHQAIAKLTSNQIKNTISQDAQHNSPLLTAFTLPGVAGGAPTAAEIKQRIVTQKAQLGVNLPGLSVGLVDNTILNAGGAIAGGMSDAAATALYTAALKQLIINQIKNGIAQINAANDPDLQALHIVANQPGVTVIQKQEALFQHRDALGVNLNFPAPVNPALNAAVHDAFLALAPAEFDDLYQRASEKRINNNLVDQLSGEISNIYGAAEHNNATLNAIIAGGAASVPTAIEIRQHLHAHAQLGNLGFVAGQALLNDFNALTGPQATDFYQQALKQLAINKVLHAIEQKLTHNDPALLAFMATGAPPNEAQIKTYLTTNANKAVYDLNFGADAAVNIQIDAAVNAMSPQEARDLYINALKQLVINKVKDHINQQVAHNDPGLVKFTELAAGGNIPNAGVLRRRLLDHRGELGLNFPNTPQMNAALNEAIASINVTNLFNEAENKLVRNAIPHAIKQKTANNDHTLAALTALNADGSRPDFKQKLNAARADLGLSSFRNVAINSLSAPEATAFYEQAQNQIAINTINHHISLKTTDGDAILTAITAGPLDNDIKTNLIAQKAALGNVDDAIINRLQTPELQALLASAQKQKMVNALHTKIAAIGTANDPIFNALVGNPTNDVLEMKRRLQLPALAAQLGFNVPVPPNNAPANTLIDGLSDAQTRGIYQKVLDKRAEVQPYYKLLDSIDATSPLRAVLTTPAIADPLKNFLVTAPMNAQDAAAFIDQLTNPTKEKAEIERMLTDEAHLAPPVTDLSKLLFAENQYKRIFSTLDPVLQAEFTPALRTAVINKISEANTPDEIDILVKALKESNKSALPTAMRDLGLNPARANAFYGEREYARLSKELANDPFLQPLLQPNEATIKAALSANPALASATQINEQIKRIKNTDKAHLLAELGNLGITNDAHAAALDEDETFGDKAYHQILSVIGETIGSGLIADEANVKAELKDIPQADIDLFLKDLKATATRDNIIGHINNFLGSTFIDPTTNPTLKHQIFAEIQCNRLIDAVRPGELKTQMQAQKPEMIEAIKRNRELKTPEQALKSLTSLRDSIYQKTDLQNAMGALGLATPPHAVDALFKENRKVYEEKTQKPKATLDTYSYSQINNNIKGFFSKIDHYHQLTSTAVASMGDREIKDLNKIDHLTFRLKEHLLLFKKSLEDIKAGRVQVNWLNGTERQNIDNLIRSIDVNLKKIEKIETNLATIHKQIKDKTGPERIAYFSGEKEVDAKVGSAAEVRDFTEAYLRGDDLRAVAPQAVAQVSTRTDTIRTTEKFGDATERAIPIKIKMEEKDIREEGRVATAAKKAGIALSSAILNNPTPPREIRGVLHQTYNSATKEAKTTLEMSEDDIKAITMGEKVGYGFRSAKIPNDAAMRVAIEIIEGARTLNPNSTEPLQLKSKYPEVVQAMVLYCKFMQKSSNGYEFDYPYDFKDKFTKEHENVLHKRLHDKDSGIYDLRHKAVGEKQAAEFRQTTATTIRPGGRH